MNKNFSLNSYQPAPIEWLIRRAIAEPGLISLAAGLVDHREFLSSEIAEITAEVLATDAEIALQYTSTQGRPELRQEIAHYFSSQGWEMDAQNLIIGSGSQQILDLIGRALFQKGDIVLLESPSYYVYVHALNNLGIRCVHVPTDHDGMIPAALRAILDELTANGLRQRVKMLYLIPYAHNPLSITMNESRKKDILEICEAELEQGAFLLLEDAAYRELCFDAPPQSFWQLAPEQVRPYIAYLGSFSKAFAPGFKIGYGHLPAELLEVVLRIKSDEDFGSSSLNQAVLTKSIRKGLFTKQSEHWRKHYQVKSNLMRQVLEENFDAQFVRFWPSSGGLYYFLEFPVELDVSTGSDFFEKSISQGVLYVPASLGFGKGSETMGRNQMRLSYGVATLEQISEGIRRLAQVFDSVWIR